MLGIFQRYNNASKDPRHWDREQLAERYWAGILAEPEVLAGLVIAVFVVLAIFPGAPLYVDVVKADDYTGSTFQYLFTDSRHCTRAEVVDGKTFETAAFEAVQRMGVDPASVGNLDARVLMTEGVNGTGRMGQKYDICLDEARARVTNVEKVNG